MMADQSCDQPLRLGAAWAHVLKRVITAAGTAGIGFFIGVQFRIDEESVLQIIYADLCRFGVGDGAQMACDLQTSFVGLLHCSLQFVAGDVGVRLERGHASISPIGYRLTRIFRSR